MTIALTDKIVSSRCNRPDKSDRIEVAITGNSVQIDNALVEPGKACFVEDSFPVVLVAKAVVELDGDNITGLQGRDIITTNITF